MALGAASSLLVHLCEIEGRLCGCGVRPHRFEYVLAYGFEIGTPCTCDAAHEIVVSIIVVWGEAVNVEGSCLNSVNENDGF